MAKKKKMAAKLAKSVQPRPETSVYTSKPVTLHIGSDHQPYYLPETLLQNLKNLPASDSWYGQIRLADMDAGTGHVLIHYLHTATYQTLKDSEDETDDDSDIKTTKNEFRKAVLALEAATRYGLVGMQQLAQLEITRRGTDINLHDTVEAIQGSFVVGSLHDHAWMRDYVLQKVRATFKQDPELFLKPDFFEGIENPALTRLLAQTIVKLYSQQVTKLRKEQTTNAQSSVHERDGTAAGSDSPHSSQLPTRPDPSPSAWTASPEKAGAFDDPVAAWDPRTLEPDQADTLEEGTPVDALHRSKKEKKARKSKSIKEHAEPSTGGVEVPSESPTETTPVMIEDEAIETNGVISEDLKASKQKNTTVSTGSPSPPPMEPSVAETPQPAVAVEDLEDPWNFSAILSTKKKKKKGLAQTQDPPLPSMPAPVPEPVPEIVSEEPAADPFAGLSKKQKKKLQKKMEEADVRRKEEDERKKLEVEISDLPQIEEEAPAPAATAADEPLNLPETPPPPPSPPPPPAEPEDPQWDPDIPEAVIEDAPAAVEPEPVDGDSWNDWGLFTSPSTKKKKKGKMLGVYEPPVPEPEAVMGSDLIEPEPVPEPEPEPEPEPAVELLEAPDPVPEVVPVPSSYDCPSREEHLFGGDGWKSCESCELYVRQIASKLHSAGLSDVNGSIAAHS